MANRTIQFLGNGYAPTGTDPITISATVDGNVVYTGSIPTSYTSEVDHAADQQAVLFTFELPVDFSGTVPMSVSLDSPVGVTVFLEQVESNYMATYNPVYNLAEINALTSPTTLFADRLAIYNAKAVPPLSSADITVLQTGTPEEKTAVLVAHNLTVTVSSGADTFLGVNDGQESKTNVVINGVAKTREAEPTGDWGWVVEFPAEGSGLFECDLTVATGQE